jgi:hypothetical protein
MAKPATAGLDMAASGTRDVTEVTVVPTVDPAEAERRARVVGEWLKKTFDLDRFIATTPRKYGKSLLTQKALEYHLDVLDRHGRKLFMVVGDYEVRATYRLSDEELAACSFSVADAQNAVVAAARREWPEMADKTVNMVITYSGGRFVTLSAKRPVKNVS